MRDRDEIENDWRGELISDGESPARYRPSGRHIDGLMLETLLDIRDLLAKDELTDK